MLVAVTGHTSGIGKACAEHYGALGFSRTNGYDVNYPQSIVEACAAADLFINSAHGGWGQATMLQAMFDSWRYQPKHIVNIGVDKVSAASWELVHTAYPIEKLAAHAMCEQLQAQDRLCRITNICLGFVENHGGDISYAHIIDAIDLCYNKQYEIRRISLGNGNQRQHR